MLWEIDRRFVASNAHPELHPNPIVRLMLIIICKGGGLFFRNGINNLSAK
jgi:hypothetical protein